MKVFFVILVVVSFSVGAACDRNKEDKSKELSPIYLQTWDPTSTVTPVSSPTPRPIPTSTFTPTPSPIPTPTFTPTASPIPVAITPEFALDVADVLASTIESMSNVTTYKYFLEGEAQLDAGGIKITVPLAAEGIVENDNATASFSTGLMLSLIHI